MQPNVVLIVLDTLRVDHSRGLDELLDYGFAKVPNAISPSSWTLPSHVSMLTGNLPSQHRVHEGRDIRPRTLAAIARTEVPANGTNLLNMTRECGYTTLCATGNPFISPMYGFDFDHYHEFGPTGEISAQALEIIGQNQRDLQVALALAKKGNVRDLFRLLDYRIKQEVGRVARIRQMEKGSKFIVDFASHTKLPTPFFLFINLMEAHEAYVWGEDFMKTVGISVLGRPTEASWWKDAYPHHAELATRRAVAIVLQLLKYDPLIIVTSDHGQLLGEKGRFGHGYSLDDVLVHVPFYIRYPQSSARLESKGAFLSLAELPRIVSSVVRDEPYAFGSDTAFSESFGYVNDLTPYLVDGDTERLDQLFQSRARVFTRDGAITFNRDTRAVEELTGKVTRAEAEALVGSVPSVEETKRPGRTAENRADEELVLERLRRLGYE